MLVARVGAQAGFATVLAARVRAQVGFATVLAARVGAQATVRVRGRISIKLDCSRIKIGNFNLILV